MEAQIFIYHEFKTADEIIHIHDYLKVKSLLEGSKKATE